MTLIFIVILVFIEEEGSRLEDWTHMKRMNMNESKLQNRLHVLVD